MSPLPPPWITTTLATFPIADAAHGQRFTTGSRVSAGHDDEAAEAGLRVNDLFLARPELVLGQIGMVRLHGQLWQAVTAPAEMCIADLLAARLTSELPTTLFAPRAPTIHTTPPRTTAPTERTPRQQALLKVAETAKALLKADAAGDAAEGLRQELNQVYDALVRPYGCIHSRANQQALKGQPELYFLRALETNVHTQGDTLVAEKTAIFTQPTLRPTPRVVLGAMTPDEALLRCLNDQGAVDLPTIAASCGQSETQVVEALAGRIFCNPETGRWETADAYLSGNIRTKLAAAQTAAVQDATYTANVAALEAVLPTPLGPDAIRAKLGAPWIPASDVRDFIIAIIPRFAGERWFAGEVVYHAPLAKWVIKDNNYARHSPKAKAEWGTDRMDAIDILECALNSRPPVVYDLIEEGDSERRVVNQPATLVAQEKWRKLCDRFSQWIWEDAARAERLCQVYNTTFNSIRRRDFDGSHLLLPGINRSILRGGDFLPHQKDAVWCALQQKATLLDLCVGAGKTFIGLAWAHEVKRLGLAQKVLITVPNHLTEQWGVEANRLYPDMRVLVMAPEDFTKARRGEFLSRIATEDFDAIICAHTSFGFIEPGHAAQQFIQREVAQLREYLAGLRAQDARGHKQSIKEIEKKVAAFETKLKELEHGITHDSARTITWDDLGIDALFVDEAHEHKNLAVPTSMGSIPGVPKGDSKRAFDMRVKTWDILGRGGRVVFATGTPILNSVGEAFVMQLYLSEQLLSERGIGMFDAWARTFAEIVPVFEMTPDGGGFRVNTRLARFVNLPELFSLWYQVTFSRSRAQLGLPTPALMGTKRIGVSVPASPRLTAYVRQLVQRVEAIKSGRVDPRDDNMLRIVSDGAKAALDTRLVAGGVAALEPDDLVTVDDDTEE